MISRQDGRHLSNVTVLLLLLFLLLLVVVIVLLRNSGFMDFLNHDITCSFDNAVAEDGGWWGYGERKRSAPGRQMEKRHKNLELQACK